MPVAKRLEASPQLSGVGLVPLLQQPAQKRLLFVLTGLIHASDAAISFITRARPKRPPS
jgi:hypothetical protein